MKTAVLMITCVFSGLALAQAVDEHTLAFWGLNEGAGETVRDGSLYGNDGTIEDAEWTEGKLGAGLLFNGQTSRVVIPDDPSLHPAGGSITIEAWIKVASDPTSWSNAGPMVYKGDAYQWAVNSNGALWLGIWGGRLESIGTYNFAEHLDEWHHAAATFDSTTNTAKLYVDGELNIEGSIGATIDPSTQVVYIGFKADNGTYFDGTIDEVRISDVVRTQEEIQSFMLSGSKPYPKAFAPTPEDGSVVDEQFVFLSWNPGAFAVSHQVYVGESFEDVNDGVMEPITPDDASLALGVAPPYATGLTPGQTYYWRVDEVNDAEPNSPWKGDVWSFTVRPLLAWDPWPTDGLKYVDPNQDLSWSEGIGTIFHNIYLGTDRETVEDATAPRFVSTDSTYDPGTLELDQTYYWRIDEFLGATARKGPVWSFTTRGTGGGVKAEYFEGMDLAGEPVLTRTEGSIDHQWGVAELLPGLADGVSARWTATLEAPFTETYTLITTSDDGVRLWVDGQVVINNWTDHGTTDNRATVEMIEGNRYSIRMEYYENTGGAVAQLSWESPTIPRQIVPQGWLQPPLWAGDPQPANGEPHAPQGPTLSWAAGDEATHHDVYFGQDAEAVATADSSSSVYQGRQPVGNTTFDPGDLEWGATYYWRVDAIDTADPDGTWTGSLWSFTTADFLIVDDFESYTDDEGSEIFATWIDGFSDGSSGSTVGHLDSPFAEQTIVHGGLQSMPLSYNNGGLHNVSEATRSWDSPQDWTVQGIDTLVLHFRGQSANTVEPVYVRLEDSTGGSATQPVPDPDFLGKASWAERTVPLSEFAGVDAGQITSMSIGIGDPAVTGTAGLVFIDDIRVVDSQAATE